VSGPGGEPLERLMRVTGLGRGVDATGWLSEASMDAVLVVLREFREAMDHYDVEAVRTVGTSALRDAANRATFSQRAASVTGSELEVLGGQDEAALSFVGATAELSPDAGPWFVTDIGGGSTELIAGPQPFGACSLDVGCVRVTERFLHHDPPHLEELDCARSWLVSQLRQADLEVPGLRAGRAMIGLAGTLAALACFDQGLSCYDRRAVHHYRLSRQAVERALDELAPLRAAQRAGRPGVEEARAPYIVGGTLVLCTVMSYFGFQECLVSEADILDGLVSTLIRSF